jgi:hypothetical protein
MDFIGGQSTVVSWNDPSIVVTGPEGALSGYLNFDACGVFSNNLPFTLGSVRVDPKVLVTEQFHH